MTELARVTSSAGRRLTGTAVAVGQRADEIERQAAGSGLLVRRELRQLVDGRMEMTLVFQRPVPRRWWHDWRAVAAVAVSTALVILGCAYAVYRAVVHVVAGAVAVFPALAGVAVLLGGLWALVALCSGGGKTFSGTFKGKIHQ